MGHFLTILTYEPSSVLKKSSNSKFLFIATGKDDESFKKINDKIKIKEYLVDTIPVISLKHTQHIYGFEIFDSSIEPVLSDIIPNYDIVHFTHPMRYCSALNICKQYNIPTVLTLTDIWLLCPRGLVTSEMEICNGPNKGEKCKELCHYDDNVLTRYNDAKLFFDSIDVVFSGSNYAKQEYLDNNWKRKIILNPFSIDYSHVHQLGHPSELIFSFMGTFSWHKGLHVLIDAFKQVDDNSIKLKIYGRGTKGDPYVQKILDMAKDDKRIEFCGVYHYNDVPEIMKDISVIVIPSNYKENYPLVMQLALAYDKPVIASNTGGMPEVIKNNVNGFLFSPGDISDLKNIIEKISKNRKQLQNIQKHITKPPRIESEVFLYEQTYQKLIKALRDKPTT